MSAPFLINGLHGDSAHVDPVHVFEGLDWRKAGEQINGCPHTVWEILFHMTYWQEHLIQLLSKEYPEYPKHNHYTFPKTSVPNNEQEWHDTLQQFRKGIKIAEAETTKDLTEQGFDDKNATRGDLLIDLITHNSYHAAQSAQIRRMTGSWPPPSGGQTW
ncbi:putative damage-inducible protein DinB [Salibacterium salarium]|uniref:DinB family protein n=1 Tax=Salibacterium salarium TaxID=284579 RepID=UPI00277F9722|nr:DinB family protein [Salibacterium salarium]MDQ0298152.1 putative damage-inducible protein DinB [Salibacterium salarium]